MTMLGKKADSGKPSRFAWRSNRPEDDVVWANRGEKVDKAAVGVLIRWTIAGLCFEWTGEIERSTVDVRLTIN